MNKCVMGIGVLMLAGTATAQPMQGAYVAPAPAVRTGLAFEANLGFGILRADADNGNSDSQNGLGGLDLGIGGYLNPRLAITLRAAGVTYSESGGHITQAFFGPSVQYFATDNVWLGGGIGVGIGQVVVDGAGSSSDSGLGLDLRAGYTFNPEAKHAFNASLEITPAFLDGGTLTGIAFLAGYQLQ
ncbi:MAG: hypothetical protein R3B06_14845 [Kofleriaceae bacterium]